MLEFRRNKLKKPHESSDQFDRIFVLEFRRKKLKKPHESSDQFDTYDRLSRISIRNQDHIHWFIEIAAVFREFIKIMAL